MILKDVADALDTAYLMMRFGDESSIEFIRQIILDMEPAKLILLESTP